MFVYKIVMTYYINSTHSMQQIDSTVNNVNTVKKEITT